MKMSVEEIGTKPWVKPDKWIVSPYNYMDEVRSDWELPDRVLMHDNTLRDGEQTPGVVFRKDEKLRIAYALADAGVQRIEGAMPSISPDDVEALATMAREIKSSEIVGFVRSRKDDLDLAIKCDVGSIIMEIPATTEGILGIWGDVEKGIQRHVELVTCAKKHGLKVTTFLPNTTLATLEEIKRIVVPAVKEGKTDHIGLADSYGIITPQAFTWLVKKVKEMVNVPIEVHCHNYWGNGTSNSLAGVVGGAEIIHACVNGLGGNASLEESVMGVEALLGTETGIKTEKLYGLSQMVRELSGIDWYKPFFDETAGSLEIGLLTALAWKALSRGEKSPTMLNLGVLGRETKTKIILGKKSGRRSIMLKAKELGLPMPTEEKAYKMLYKVKQLSIDKKGIVTEEEFKRIYNEIGP
jgi:methanogen homocitrate synthase